MFKFLEGDRVAVVHEGKAMKARVVGFPTEGLIAVTFTKTGEPVLFDEPAVFPLYRYPGGLNETEYVELMPLCLIQNEQLHESGPKE